MNKNPINKLPSSRRRRAFRIGVDEPGETRRPFRFWMTGSLAVVMAAMLPLSDSTDASDAEPDTAMRLLRHSRYSVGETVQRLEAAARDQGLSVLALMPGAHPVLVLGSSVGGTLVVMQEADSRPAMPLSVMVREASEGGADVMVAQAATERPSLDWQDLPAAVVDDLAALPVLVDRALV
jgi:uncharacterized protein (DUF302 family)